MSLPATSTLRPPICLTYVIWALAASLHDKYTSFEETFYHRARESLVLDEMKG